jgi:cytochrome c oxidase subunit II
MLGTLLGTLLAFCLVLFVRRPAWFPESITSFGRQFDRQFEITLILSAIAFAIVHLALIGAIGLKPKRVHNMHNPWLIETVWTAVVSLIFVSLAFEGTRIWAGVHPMPDAAGAERIEVYAQQFAWHFRYPGPDGRFGRTSPQHINDVLDNPFGIDPADPAGNDDIRSATLRVPSGREIILLLHSRDVIHDFFVRELRFKQDVVPGMEIPYRFKADQTGIFEIACSELCGIGHSQMRATVEVMLPEKYDEWKRARSLAATTK